MPSRAGKALHRVTRQGRLTRRVFWDLAIYMVGLGLIVGAIFPPFARLLGVDRAQAMRPAFVIACLVAGFLVGAMNYGLSRVVVGRRLMVLSTRLRLVADAIASAGFSGNWLLTSGTSRIHADSDDALGDTARAFNSLLDALAAGEHSRSLVHNSSDVITVVDREGTIRYHTPSISWVLGLVPSELIGHPVCDLVHPDDVARMRRNLRVIAATPGSHSTPVRVRVRHGEGSWRTVETAGNNLLADPAVHGIVLTTRDISDRIELEDRLRHQAFHDSLSGLPNRALFLERVSDAQRRSDAAPLAVLFIDLDNLKVVNDSTGHEGGDRLLAAVADRLRSWTRPGDTAARLGGDEFAVLLVGEDTAACASEVADQLLAELSRPLTIAGRTIRPSMSVGVASSASLGRDKDLVRAADGAMYAAKKAGKNRVEVYQPSHHAAEMARQQLRADLHEALDGDQFVLHYQPIVDLVTGGITSMEALVRWQHPTLGMLAPGEFIPLAEEGDLILAIGGWVLRQACQQAGDWQHSGSRGAGVKVSVNLSARQLRDPGLVAVVAAAAGDARLDPSLLVLELTETMLLQHGTDTRSRLSELRDLGINIALDDFGTGYSSLSYLRRFPIDTLKMDRSFLDEVPGNVQDEALVRGIVELGSTLGLQLIAEGIETAEQAEALAALGCPFGQGYHFAQPMPYLKALTLLARPPISSPFESDGAAAIAIVPAMRRRRYGN